MDDNLSDIMYKLESERLRKERQLLKEKLQSEDEIGKYIERAQIVNFQPGDVFVLTLKNPVTDTVFDMMVDEIKSLKEFAFPNNKFVLLRDFDIQVYRPSENEPTK